MISTIGNIASQGIEKNNLITFKKTIYVDDDNINGPWNGTKENPYRYISDGILNSTNDDVIFVLNGRYNETLNIDKSIILKGENKIKTIIDGAYSKEIINLSEDGIELLNFTIKNSGGYQYDSAIKVNTNNNRIKSCEIYRNKIGAYLKNSHHNLIDNCTFHTNGEAIFLDKSDENIISGCVFSHNSIGIHFEKSNYNNISYCYSYENGISIYLNDSEYTNIIHSNISDNSVNLGGIFIENSNMVTINNSIINHNGAGVSLSSSNEIRINNCNINKNTHFAISLRQPSKDIFINNCEIIDNLRYGIYVQKLNSVKITKNNIYSNKLFGIYSRFSKCNSRLNYWGSILGPAYFESLKRSRISGLIGWISYFPWNLRPIREVGANWRDNEDYMKKIIIEAQPNTFNFSEKDVDEDGLPDWWEEKWGYSPFIWDDHANLDEDNDALNNFEECYTDEYGSNPFYRDIFLEIDWMEPSNSNILNKPSESLIEEIIEIFKINDISLHIDIGNLNGGEEIPICNSEFSYAKLQDLYWKYFLHNDLNNPRKGIFHYGVICNYCPDLNFPFFGWDQFDSFAISGKWLKEINPQKSIDSLIGGAMVHHLGHTLGLTADTFDGIDNIGSSRIFTLQWLKYRNYESCMNYRYKYKILTFSDGTNGRGDFNDWDNLDFSFFKNSKFE
jgi:parallel beta-helix repeat protein